MAFLRNLIMIGALKSVLSHVSVNINLGEKECTKKHEESHAKRHQKEHTKKHYKTNSEKKSVENKKTSDPWVVAFVLVLVFVIIPTFMSVLVAITKNWQVSVPIIVAIAIMLAFIFATLSQKRAKLEAKNIVILNEEIKKVLQIQNLNPISSLGATPILFLEEPVYFARSGTKLLPREQLDAVGVNGKTTVFGRWLRKTVLGTLSKIASKITGGRSHLFDALMQNAAQEGTLYLSDSWMAFVNKQAVFWRYGDLNMIECDDVGKTNARVRLFLRNGGALELLVPCANRQLINAYLDKLLGKYKELKLKCRRVIPADNKCPQCRAELKDGCCEYCRWEAPPKAVA